MAPVYGTIERPRRLRLRSSRQTAQNAISGHNGANECLCAASFAAESRHGIGKSGAAGGDERGARPGQCQNERGSENGHGVRVHRSVQEMTDGAYGYHGKHRSGEDTCEKDARGLTDDEENSHSAALTLALPVVRFPFIKAVEIVMKAWIIAVFVLVARGGVDAQQPVWQPSAGHAQVPIWPGAVPDAQPPAATEHVEAANGPKDLVAGRPWLAVEQVSRPTMTVYSPKGKNTGVAVVVFPGGGYQILAIDLEGTEVCDWLTSKGITCVLLKYRVPDSGPA